MRGLAQGVEKGKSADYSMSCMPAGSLPEKLSGNIRSCSKKAGNCWRRQKVSGYRARYLRAVSETKIIENQDDRRFSKVGKNNSKKILLNTNNQDMMCNQ